MLTPQFSRGENRRCRSDSRYLEQSQEASTKGISYLSEHESPTFGLFSPLMWGENSTLPSIFINLPPRRVNGLQRERTPSPGTLPQPASHASLPPTPMVGEEWKLGGWLLSKHLESETGQSGGVAREGRDQSGAGPRPLYHLGGIVSD